MRRHRAQFAFTASIQTSILERRGATWTSLISNKQSKPQPELSSISALPPPLGGFLSSVKGSTIHQAARLENWSAHLTSLSPPPATSTPVVLCRQFLLKIPRPLSTLTAILSPTDHCNSLLSGLLASSQISSFFLHSLARVILQKCKFDHMLTPFKNFNGSPLPLRHTSLT